MIEGRRQWRLSFHFLFGSRGRVAPRRRVQLAVRGMSYPLGSIGVTSYWGLAGFVCCSAVTAGSPPYLRCQCDLILVVRCCNSPVPLPWGRQRGLRARSREGRTGRRAMRVSALESGRRVPLGSGWPWALGVGRWMVAGPPPWRWVKRWMLCSSDDDVFWRHYAPEASKGRIAASGPVLVLSEHA